MVLLNEHQALEFYYSNRDSHTLYEVEVGIFASPEDRFHNDSVQVLVSDTKLNKGRVKRTASRIAHQSGHIPFGSTAESLLVNVVNPDDYDNADFISTSENAFALTAEEVAKQIGIPLERWPGNCYSIACSMVEKGIVQGKAVYGHYLGEIAKGSMFFGRPIVSHGWIKTADNKIIDPTRWAFLCSSPMIFTCDTTNKDYDEGGNRHRMSMRKPCPVFSGTEEQYSLEPSSEEGKAILAFVSPLPERQSLCRSECFWLANLSLFELKELAKPVYSWLKDKDLEGYIPIDNLSAVIG